MWWWYGFPSLKITLTFLLLIITEKLQYYLLQGRSLSPRFVQTYALLYNFFPEDLRREAGVISNCIQVNASSIRMSFRIKRNTVDRSAVKISPRRESQLMAIKHFHKGFPVWVENVYEEKSSQYRASLLPQNYCTRPTWIPATVYSVDNANRTVEVRTTFSPSKTVHLTTDKIWARNNTRKPLEDMVYFHHLHEPAIVNNIMVRYLSQQIYTRAGEILIVMNPYKLCRDKDGISIYDEMYMRKYRVKSEGTRSGGNPPHIFEVANRAFIRLREDGKPQSIVISGESGCTYRWVFHALVYVKKTTDSSFAKLF